MFEKIRGLIAEQLYIDADTIKRDSDFKKDLGADSLDIVQMLIAMENEFGISFEDEDLKEIQTVGQAVDKIEQKLQ